MESQWKGKKIAFLGDSLTDPGNGELRKYWSYLEEDLGIIPYVYGISGRRWADARNQAQLLHEQHGNDVDAIFLFFGANDYMGSVPLGEWYNLRQETIIVHGGQEKLMPRRSMTTGNVTLRGSINDSMAYIKETFPTQQVIILTPPHRGYCKFSETNVQPSEEYPNLLGIYHDEYIRVIREAGDVWAVPVIDLYSESGLYPLAEAQVIPYFRPNMPDFMHPNPLAQKRLAQVIRYRLLAMPPSFE